MSKKQDISQLPVQNPQPPKQGISQLPPKKPMPTLYKAFFAFLAGGTLLVLCCGISLGGRTSPTPTAVVKALQEVEQEESTNTPRPTVTQVPTRATTDTPEPEPTDAPESTETPVPPADAAEPSTTTPTNTPAPTEPPASLAETEASLPGLLPADVTVNLEDRGFTCTGVEQFEVYFIWRCEMEQSDHHLSSEVWSRDLLTVDSIDNFVTPTGGMDKELATQFLGFVATMPYEGSEPEKARAWVEETINIRGQGIYTTTLGDVKYGLSVSDNGYLLVIGELIEVDSSDSSSTNTPEPGPTNTATVPAQVPTEPPPLPTETPTVVPVPPTPVPQVPQAAKIIILSVNKSEEYVDLQNAGGQAQDLTGWRLLSERGSQDCALGGAIGPGETLRIWAMSEDAGQGGFNCGFGSNIWNNEESDPAVLFDVNGQEVARK